MAQLSRGGPPNDRPYDGASQLSQQQRRTFGDLGEGFPKLRRDIDLADSDIHRIKKFQKYLKDNRVITLQHQMEIACALRCEGVLSDRVWYTMHTLVRAAIDSTCAVVVTLTDWVCFAGCW